MKPHMKNLAPFTWQSLVPHSLSKGLLLGIFIPVLLFITIDTVLLYKQALVAVNIAYDRTLLASAKSIGEQLIITGQGDDEKIEAHIQYSAVEAFEADTHLHVHLENNILFPKAIELEKTFEKVS